MPSSIVGVSPGADSNTASFITPSGDTFIVDAADAEYVSQFKWWAQNQGRTAYVLRKGRTGEPQTVTLQRSLLGVTDRGIVVDHVNRNGLDNRRSNLRTATHSQNHGNAPKLRRKRPPSSVYKGVVWHKRNHTWIAVSAASTWEPFLLRKRRQSHTTTPHASGLVNSLNHKPAVYTITLELVPAEFTPAKARSVLKTLRGYLDAHARKVGLMPRPGLLRGRGRGTADGRTKGSRSSLTVTLSASA